MSDKVVIKKPEDNTILTTVPDSLRVIMKGNQGGSSAYWDRSGTTLSPRTSGDSVDLGIGGITSTGPGTFGQIIDNGLTASLGVYTDASKQLTSTAPSTGILGYWSRTGTTISPSNAGDDFSIASNIFQNSNTAYHYFGLNGDGSISFSSNKFQFDSLTSIALNADTDVTGNFTTTGTITSTTDDISLHPTATVVVAAVDSRGKDAADFVCDGTNDQVTIESAIAALVAATSDDVYETVVTNVRSQKLQGGKVVLLAGGYHITAPIDITSSSVSIEGEGTATTIFNDATDGSHAINVDGTGEAYGLWHIRMRNFRVQGNVNSGDGIHIYKSPHTTIEDIVAVRNGGAGFYIEAMSGSLVGADNSIVSDCRATINYGHGMHFKLIHEILVNNCHIEENLGDGIYCDTVTDFHLNNCSIEDQDQVGGGAGLRMVNANAPRLSNNTFEDSLVIGLIGAGTTLYTGNTLGTFTLTGGTNSIVQMTGNRCQAITTSGSIAVLDISNCHVSTLRLESTAAGSELTYSNNSQTDSNTGKFTFANAKFTGSRVRFRSASTFSESLEFVGGELIQYVDITAGERLAITGVNYYTSADHSLKCSAANAIWNISGNSFYLPYVLTIDGNGNGSTAKLNFSSNTVRLNKITVDDFDRVAFTGNLLQGYTTTTFSSIDTILSFVGNTLQNGADITIDNTCSARTLVAMNNVSVNSNLTNNGTGETAVTLNMNDDPSTWGKNIGVGEIDLTSIFNTTGTLKLQPDVEGDVSLFEDTDIADNVDGKSLYLYRKSADERGDRYIQMYLSQWGTAVFKADANIQFQTTGTNNYIYFRSDADMYFNVASGKPFYFRNNTSNQDIRMSFTGTTNSGEFRWMEDEDYFQFYDDVLLQDNEKLFLGSAADTSVYFDGLDLVINSENVTANDEVHFTNFDFYTFDNPVKITTIKSGSTQGNAGAAADETWKTSGHATLPDNVLMIGV